MKTLLILGNDKLSQLAVSKISLNSHFKILIDKSTNIKKIFKLLAKGVINPFLLAKMYYSELRRKSLCSLELFKSINENSVKFFLNRLYTNLNKSII
jgi:hypothetical protein